MAFVTAVLTNPEIRAALDVAGSLAGAGDLPDPVGWVDLRSSDDATVAAIRHRLETRLTPQRGQVFRWPKEKGGYRPMAWIDPLDQLAYRGVVGRLVSPIAASIDSTKVVSNRVVAKPPSWKLEPYGKAVRERRRRGVEMLGDHPVLGLIDVKNFFPSVRRPALEANLGSLPVHGPTFEWLLDWLDELADVSGIKGLPTGHEPSQVLASGLLVDCDKVLSDLGVPFMRYVDDTWMFLDWVSDYEPILDRYKAELGTLDLEVNPSKSRRVVGSEALNEVQRLAISYLEEELRDPGPVGIGAALDLFDHALEAPAERKSELRVALSSLGRHRHDRPLTALRSDSDLLGIAPKHWVGYLSSMMGAKPSRNLVGDDWLIDQVTSTVTKDGGYKNLLYLQVASKLKLDRDLGRRVFDVATYDGGWKAPVRVWAAHVWGRSDAFSPNTAIEQVEERGDYSTKRAFALTLDQRRTDPNLGKWLRQVRLANPELDPTATWLEVP